MTPPDTVAEDLGQLPWFQVVGTEQYVAQVLDQIDLDNAPHIVEAESFEFACAMVSQGLGVSLIPESAVTGSTHSESTTPTVRVPISVIANTLDSTSSELVTNLLRQFGRHTRDVASSHTEPARQAR